MRRTAIGLSSLLFILTTSAHAEDQAAQRAALNEPDCGFVCVFADSVGERDLERHTSKAEQPAEARPPASPNPTEPVSTVSASDRQETPRGNF
jgi:hypothetical protein